MMELPKPDIIFTHESDLDGLVAGLLLKKLAKKLHNREVPVEAYHYNYWKQRELREKAAWVTDFTYEPRLDKEEWGSSLTITSPTPCRKTPTSSTT
jgi:hypothetical protein